MKPEKQLLLAIFCLLVPAIGTFTTDVSIGEGQGQTSPLKVVTPTKDPKEAAREAALQLSKEIFRNITKHLRDSIAANDLSMFTTTVDNTDDKDELHPLRHQPKHHHEYHWGPYFDGPEGEAKGALAVNAHLASEALLNCRVGMLRDKTVMWLRKTADKVHLLTVGATTYSGDSRIGVKFQYPNNWRLSILPVQREDAGLYMCQVSTHPPRVMLTNVTVLAPILKIVDEQGHEVRDRYYKSGSSIELSCRVSRAYTGALSTATSSPNPLILKPPLLQTTTPMTTTTTQTATSGSVTNSTTPVPKITPNEVTQKPPIKNNTLKDNKEITVQNNNVFGITWMKDGKPLTDKVSWRNMSSTYKLAHADQKDSGAYACSILNASTVTVQVQVLSGETQAAVHHDTWNIGNNIVITFHIPLPYCIFILFMTWFATIRLNTDLKI